MQGTAWWFLRKIRCKNWSHGDQAQGRLTIANPSLGISSAVSQGRKIIMLIFVRLAL